MIDGADVLKVATLAGADPSGVVRHVVGGELVEQFVHLAIARYPGDDAAYLLFCDADWRSVTDTWHESVDAAREQAEREWPGAVFRNHTPRA